MATRSPRKKTNGSIKIQTQTERKLLDAKILGKKKSRLPQIVAGAVVAGFIAGAGLLIYARISQDTALTGSLPNIKIPDTKDPAPSATSTPEVIEPAPAPAPQPPASPSESEAGEAQKQYIRVSDTPTGTLNVRTGPGTNYPKIGQVTPGQEFEVIKYDAAGWYEIKLTGGTGWVTKQYVTVK